METEKSYNNQNEQRQNEAEEVLSSMSSFEEHMAEMSSADSGKIVSPINGGELTPTERPDIMSSEYDDILYKVTEQGQVIPLKSPINGGELTPTERPDIMSSEYDDILYKVTEQGQVIPLKSPINGGELAVSGENKFIDYRTMQEFELDESGKLVPFSDAA